MSARTRYGFWRMRLHERTNMLMVRLFGAAPDEDRCIMGSTVSKEARCRHKALGFWCRKHYTSGWWD